jgi:hypothetical protein
MMKKLGSSKEVPGTTAESTSEWPKAAAAEAPWFRDPLDMGASSVVARLGQDTRLTVAATSTMEAAGGATGAGPHAHSSLSVLTRLTNHRGTHKNTVSGAVTATDFVFSTDPVPSLRAEFYNKETDAKPGFQFRIVLLRFVEFVDAWSLTPGSSVIGSVTQISLFAFLLVALVFSLSYPSRTLLF